MRAKRGFIRRRAPTAGITIIMITGRGIAAIAQHAQRHRFAAAGAEYFFQVPFSRSPLIDKPIAVFELDGDAYRDAGAALRIGEVFAAHDLDGFLMAAFAFFCVGFVFILCAAKFADIEGDWGHLVLSFQSADDQIFISAGKIFFEEFLVAAGSDGGMCALAGFIVHCCNDDVPELPLGNFKECFAGRQESATVI